jgi:hypothetical protein
VTDAPQEDDLADLLRRVERIEPAMKRRVWPPMTYMGIPSMLDRARELMRRLAVLDVPEARKALIRLYELRRDFRREA